MSNGTTTTSSSSNLVYFPFVILAGVLFIVSLVSKIKDIGSFLTSNFIAFLGVEETIFILVQWIVAIATLEDTTTTTRRELFEASDRNTCRIVVFVVTLAAWLVAIV